MGNYKCMICEDTGKPFKKFEDVEYMDINYHFSKHHPVQWKSMMEHIAVQINGEWVKPNSVDVSNVKKEIDKSVIKDDKKYSSQSPHPKSTHPSGLPPAKDN